MKALKYPTEKEPVVTYPVEIPLKMFLMMEEAARDERRTVAEFVRDCFECELEAFLDSKFHRERKARDMEGLKRLSKRKKIIIVEGGQS